MNDHLPTKAMKLLWEIQTAIADQNSRKARRERMTAALAGGDWACPDGAMSAPEDIADFAESLLNASDAIDDAKRIGGGE